MSPGARGIVWFCGFSLGGLFGWERVWERWGELAAEDLVHVVGGALFHGGLDVAVEGEGGSDVGVTEELLDGSCGLAAGLEAMTRR